MSEFYVGYQPTAPPGLHRLLRRTVLELAALALAIAGVLVAAQAAFPPARFEFLEERILEGTLEERPYPALLVRRPGGEPPSRYLLVGLGKHGAGAEVRGRGGQEVRLRGKLIYRDDQTMIELTPGSLSTVGTSTLATKAEQLGPATLTGEIVDTKCYTGVMNPGQGKVHRECAARCLSGGLPPGFLVRDAAGRGTVYVLTDAHGDPPPSQELLPRVAEPVTLSGTLVRSGDTLFFRVQSFH